MTTNASVLDLVHANFGNMTKVLFLTYCPDLPRARPVMTVNEVLAFNELPVVFGQTSSMIEKVKNLISESEYQALRDRLEALYDRFEAAQALVN